MASLADLLKALGRTPDALPGVRGPQDVTPEAPQGLFGLPSLLQMLGRENSVAPETRSVREQAMALIDSPMMGMGVMDMGVPTTPRAPMRSQVVPGANKPTLQYDTAKVVYSQRRNKKVAPTEFWSYSDSRTPGLPHTITTPQRVQPQNMVVDTGVFSELPAQKVDHPSVAGRGYDTVRGSLGLIAGWRDRFVGGGPGALDTALKGLSTEEIFRVAGRLSREAGYVGESGLTMPNGRQAKYGGYVQGDRPHGDNRFTITQALGVSGGEQRKVAAHELGQMLVGIGDKDFLPDHFVTFAEQNGFNQNAIVNELLNGSYNHVRKSSWQSAGTTPKGFMEGDFGKNEQYTKYLTSTPELYADGLALMITRPGTAARDMPNFYEMIRTYAREDPVISQLVRFATPEEMQRYLSKSGVEPQPNSIAIALALQKADQEEAGRKDGKKQRMMTAPGDIMPSPTDSPVSNSNGPNLPNDSATREAWSIVR